MPSPREAFEADILEASALGHAAGVPRLAEQRLSARDIRLVSQAVRDNRAHSAALLDQGVDPIEAATRWAVDTAAALGPDPGQPAGDLEFQAAARRQSILEKLRPVSAEDERQADIPPRQWSVEGMIPRGDLSLLSARKGLGKSWLALAIAQAVGSGSQVLGRRAFRGRVLVLLSELDRIGFHDRAQVLGSMPGVDVVYGPLPRGEAAVEALSALIEDGGYTLVIVDMLQSILPANAESNSYEIGNYLLSVRQVAMAAGAAILGTWHQGKGDREDPVLGLIGSTGIGAQAGSILVLDRKRGEPTGRLYISGNHAQESTIGYTFDAGRFTLAEDQSGPGPKIAPADRVVLEELKKSKAGLTAPEIGAMIGKPADPVRMSLNRLHARGLAHKLVRAWYASVPSVQDTERNGTEHKGSP